MECHEQSGGAAFLSSIESDADVWIYRPLWWIMRKIRESHESLLKMHVYSKQLFLAGSKNSPKDTEWNIASGLNEKNTDTEKINILVQPRWMNGILNRFGEMRSVICVVLGKKNWQNGKEGDRSSLFCCCYYSNCPLSALLITAWRVSGAS